MRVDVLGVPGLVLCEHHVPVQGVQREHVVEGPVGCVLGCAGHRHVVPHREEGLVRPVVHYVVAVLRGVCHEALGRRPVPSCGRIHHPVPVEHALVKDVAHVHKVERVGQPGVQLASQLLQWVQRASGGHRPPPHLSRHHPFSRIQWHGTLLCGQRGEIQDDEIVHPGGVHDAQPRLTHARVVVDLGDTQETLRCDVGLHPRHGCGEPPRHGARGLHEGVRVIHVEGLA